MKPKLPLSYFVELGADTLTLRRHDGSTVANFSARGVALKLVEATAWEDYGDPAPSPGGEKASRRPEGNFLATFLGHLALVTTLRAGLKGT
jgi:hypothetical protein